MKTEVERNPDKHVYQWRHGYVIQRATVTSWSETSRATRQTVKTCGRYTNIGVLNANAYHG